MRVYQIRIIKYPEGSDDSEWEPEEYNHELYGPFRWPRRRNYFSEHSAHTRARLLRKWGATVEVVQSNSIVFPDQDNGRYIKTLEDIIDEMIGAQ